MINKLLQGSTAGCPAQGATCALIPLPSGRQVQPPVTASAHLHAREPTRPGPAAALSRCAMKLAAIILAAAPALVLSACGTSAALSAQRSAEPSSPARSAAPAPVITKTVIKQITVPAAPATASPASQAPVTIPNVTNPWAVVSAYYGDVESGDYPEAWTLLSSGMVTG